MQFSFSQRDETRADRAPCSTTQAETEQIKIRVKNERPTVIKTTTQEIGGKIVDFIFYRYKQIQ